LSSDVLSASSSSTIAMSGTLGIARVSPCMDSSSGKKPYSMERHKPTPVTPERADMIVR
jgi:hypothetical protein